MTYEFMSYDAIVFSIRNDLSLNLNLTHNTYIIYPVTYLMMMYNLYSRTVPTLPIFFVQPTGKISIFVF